MTQRRDADFEKVFESFTPLIRSMAGKYHVPGMDRDDWQQEASIAVVEALDSYDPDRHGHLRGYVRNKVRRHLSNLRRDAGEQPACATDVFAGGVIPEDLEIGKAAADAGLLYEEMISDLGGLLNERELRALTGMADGFADKDIAEELGATPAAVRMARKRARGKIRADGRYFFE